MRKESCFELAGASRLCKTLYSSISHPRNESRRHPLAAITYCTFTAIREQLALGAEDQEAAVQGKILWHGFSDLQISESFQKVGEPSTPPCPPALIPRWRLAMLFVSLRRTELSSCGSSPRTTLKGVLLSSLVPVSSRPFLYISYKKRYFEGTRTAHL